MNYTTILAVPVFAFVLFLLIFASQKTQTVCVPLHVDLDTNMYRVISIDTLSKDSFTYKMFKYKKK